MKTYYDEDKYHLVAAVTAPGAGGAGSRAPGSICKHPNKLSLNRGYGPHECNVYSPPEPVDDCTPTIRIAFTAEVILNLLY